MSNEYQKTLEAVRAREHAGCFVCGTDAPGGLRVDYRAAEDGSVGADVVCDESCSGYPGWLHGGFVSTLLDGAMCNCLFAHDIVAATGELNIRFRDSVPVTERLFVRAELTKSRPPLHLLRAELLCGDEVVVEATAKFMQRPAAADAMGPG